LEQRARVYDRRGSGDDRAGAEPTPETGILHPGLAHLLASTGHTDWFTVCDRGFPVPLGPDRIDLALVPGIPTVLDVLDLLTPVFKIGRIWQAHEFVSSNGAETVDRFAKSFGGIPLTREPHVKFKKRVPQAIGLIRTGDPTVYGNLILESE